MQVEIWSDFACPFCYIGKRRFEKALADFAHRDHVEVVYRSFELDRHAPKHVPHDVYDMLSSRYGMSRQEAIAMNEKMRQQAVSEGIDFQFDGIVLTNTFDAHRLRLFAESKARVPRYPSYCSELISANPKILAITAPLQTSQQQQGLIGKKPCPCSRVISSPSRCGPKKRMAAALVSAGSGTISLTGNMRYPELSQAAFT